MCSKAALRPGWRPCVMRSMKTGEPWDTEAYELPGMPDAPRGRIWWNRHFNRWCADVAGFSLSAVYTTPASAARAVEHAILQIENLATWDTLNRNPEITAK